VYSPKTYMTMDVLADLLKEFEWPAPYQLEDWLPDGIAVVFPKCQLFFSEGFESHMSLKFLAESPGLGETVNLHDLMVSLGGLHTPGLDETLLPQASLDKVKIGVRNLCKIVLTHFRGSILGDFNWYAAYKRK